MEEGIEERMKEEEGMEEAVKDEEEERMEEE